jgi:hypothetical protein
MEVTDAAAAAAAATSSSTLEEYVKSTDTASDMPPPILERSADPKRLLDMTDYEDPRELRPRGQKFLLWTYVSPKTEPKSDEFAADFIGAYKTTDEAVSIAKKISTLNGGLLDYAVTPMGRFVHFRGDGFDGATDVVYQQKQLAEFWKGQYEERNRERSDFETRVRDESFKDLAKRARQLGPYFQVPCSHVVQYTTADGKERQRECGVFFEDHDYTTLRDHDYHRAFYCQQKVYVDKERGHVRQCGVRIEQHDASMDHEFLNAKLPVVREDFMEGLKVAIKRMSDLKRGLRAALAPTSQKTTLSFQADDAPMSAVEAPVQAPVETTAGAPAETTDAAALPSPME